jgi:CheY-like chemotaxis protein
LNGDPLRLRQILINLLSNAVKFTERGEIVLLVDVVETRPQEALLRFHVKDSGIGIPPDAQQRIFKAFDQADSSTTRKYGGTGLGLAIVNRLVELMGGVIGVDSAPGEGSTFWFVIRLRMGAQPPTTVGPFLQGRRLLIVDDNETNRVIVAHHVHRWGADAACAASAPEALALLHQAVDEHRPYDAAILDMQMPGMDGLALATAIQSGRYLSAIRLLMLTSLGDQGPAAAAAGIRRTLTKPVSHTRLREALMTLFDAEPAGVAPDAAAERPASTSGSVLLAEDNAVNREVALGMLEMLGYRVQAVENGRLAVQAATAHRFDLVLMDCQMPEMDGFEATRLIREREASLVQPDGKDERRTTTGEGRVTPHVPIVALTANAMQGDREACLDAGMDAYLRKPFTLQQLQVVLAHWLDPRSTSATPDHRPNPSDTPTDKNRPPAPDGLALVDREAWKAVTAIQRPSQSDLLARILGLYLKDSQGLVDKIAEAVGRGGPAATSGIRPQF